MIWRTGRSVNITCKKRRDEHAENKKNIKKRAGPENECLYPD